MKPYSNTKLTLMVVYHYYSSTRTGDQGWSGHSSRWRLQRFHHFIMIRLSRVHSQGSHDCDLRRVRRPSTGFLDHRMTTFINRTVTTPSNHYRPAYPQPTRPDIRDDYERRF